MYHAINRANEKKATGSFLTETGVRLSGSGKGARTLFLQPWLEGRETQLRQRGKGSFSFF
jgi:hypothetical protein